jgi:hypothetical protein
VLLDVAFLEVALSFLNEFEVIILNVKGRVQPLDIDVASIVVNCSGV